MSKIENVRMSEGSDVIKNCSTDCSDKKSLDNEAKNKSSDVNHITYFTSSEGELKPMNMLDLEVSDQPFEFHEAQLKTKPTCAAECGLIKEAETSCHSCHQVCHYIPGFSPGHVKCGCYHGYAIGPDWLHCIDIDECSVDPWLCHGGTCLNTVGSFICRCRPGYQLVGHMCVDIDECTKSKGMVGMCDQLCLNVPGTYQCWCHKGFTVSNTNPRSCVDIDECISNVCSHSCSNTVGSFICTCPPNMRLHTDGRTCVLLPEVQDRNLAVDITTRNIIIDGSRKIIIYGNNDTEQLYRGSWPETAATVGQIEDRSNDHITLNLSTDNTQFVHTERNLTLLPHTRKMHLPYHTQNRTNLEKQSEFIHNKDMVQEGISQQMNVTARNQSTHFYKDPLQTTPISKTVGLTNVLPAFSSTPEILTVRLDERDHVSVQPRKMKPDGKNYDMSQHKYGPCIPTCRNGGVCDGRRKCHCRHGFQGRYCQIDVNECSSVPSLCTYLCINTFGSYQCLCPSGYKISNDRKFCLAESGHIQASPVLVNNNQSPHNNGNLEMASASVDNKKYNAVIEVLINPNKPISDYELQLATQKFIQPSFDATFTSADFTENSKMGPVYISMKTGTQHSANSQTRLSIENLHTAQYDGNNLENLFSVISSDPGNEQVLNELQPTSALHQDFEVVTSLNNEFVLLQSDYNSSDSLLKNTANTLDDSSINVFVPLASSVTYNKEIVTPALTYMDIPKNTTRQNLEEVFSLIMKSDKEYSISNSTFNNGMYEKENILNWHIFQPTKSEMTGEITILPSFAKESMQRKNTAGEISSTSTRMYLHSHLFQLSKTPVVRNESLSVGTTSEDAVDITHNHDVGDTSRAKDHINDMKKHKGKGKKTKKLNHKDEKQKKRKDKEKKIKNKTLKRGRIKLVRLTKNFQVLNQILDASRERWRSLDVGSPFIGKSRTDPDWNMGPLDEVNNPSGAEDRYFEVIDYDDDYEEPPKARYNDSDLFAPSPLILSNSDSGQLPSLPILPRGNETRKLERNCFYGKRMVRSRTTVYQDQKNCTKCTCKDGELHCSPRHCPTPHCEAPIHGNCCDYCPNDCLVENEVYLPGERFISPIDHCRECHCVSGRAVCDDIHCPALKCSQEYRVRVPQQCCPVCLPPEPGCFYKGRFFYQGQLWVRKEGGCQACLCKDGEVQCNPVVCVVNCQHPQFIPGECCPLCEGCQHYNHKYDNQELFPHPSDSCSVCHCQQGNITCYAKPCNISCSHPYRPAGDCCPVCRHCYFNDRKISNGASLMIKNGTCQECTCKQGNVTCKSAACASDCIIRGKPIPSGAEFHIGSDTCTQCRCWNGTVSCHAVECYNICSHGVLLPHRCCLDCTKCDYQGQLYAEMQVFRPNGDSCKSCLCVKGNVMCQDTCNTLHPEH